MSEKTLLKSLDQGVLTLTLNRPTRKNALNQMLLMEIVTALREAEAFDAVRCIVICGAEGNFCAGADITELKKIENAYGGYKFSRSFQECFQTVEELEKPVVAAVEGFALGGGCELLISCDYKIASQEAKIGLSEIKIGALPAGGGTVKLAQLVGPLKAMEMVSFGEAISGTEAQQIGLVNKAVPAEKVMEEAYSWARRLAEKPTIALSTIKRLIHSTTHINLDNSLRAEAQSLGVISDTEDFREGTGAFLEKRKPTFNGR